MSDQLVAFEEKKLEVISNENGDIELSETPEGKLAKGKDYLSKHEYDPAVYWLTEAALDDNAKAYVLLGDIHSTSDSGYKDSNKALSYYKKAYELDNSNKKITYNLAIGYYNESDYKKSFLYLEKCVELDVDASFTNKQKAECCSLLGSFQKSPKWYKNEEGKYSYIPEEISLDKAIEYYNKAVILDKDNIESIISLAKIYADKVKDPNKAVFYYKKCLDVISEDKKAQANCIQSLVKIGVEEKLLEPMESMELLKKAYTIDESDLSYAFDLGSNYYRAEDEQNAIYYLEKCIENNSLTRQPEIASKCSYYLGKLYGNTESARYNLAKSVGYYQKLYDLQNSKNTVIRNGVSDEGLYRLATGYKDLQNIDSAIIYLEKCIKDIYSRSYPALCSYFLGKLYSDMLNDKTKAVEYYELAHKKDPEDIDYIVSLKNIYSTIQNTEKENFYLKKCLDFSANSDNEKATVASCNSGYGYQLYKNKEYTQAIEAFKKAYDISPTCNQLYNIGALHKITEDEQSAKQYFEQCINFPSCDQETLAQCTELLGSSHDD